MAPRSRVLTSALVALVVLGAGACGDDDGDGDADSGGRVDAERVDVSEAWARSSPAGVTDGAAYMTIESNADDELIGAEVPADVAAAVAFHETVVGGSAADDMEGHDMPPSEGTSGAMTMQHVPKVDLPSGEAVVFEPGGLHVMLVDLAGPLVSGSSFELTLTFADAAPQIVAVEIRDEAP